MEENLKRLYEFGPFRLDAGERLLLRDGEVVPLTPKAFDLLLALVEQPGHLLEKDALLKTVWPDSFVEENNLADNISRLRKALGEGDQGRKFIETVPRRGYRFVAEVKELSDAVSLPPRHEELAAASLPVRHGVRFPLHKRPEVLLITFGFLALVLLGLGLYLRFRPTSRAAVELLEFKGNFYINQWTEAEIRKGLEYYQRAIALDPHSASAYDGLANGWIFLSDMYMSPREAMPKAQAANAQVLQLDKTFFPAHAGRGV